MVKVKEFALGWVIKLNVFFFLVTLGVKILRTDLAYKRVKASRFHRRVVGWQKVFVAN